jgi:hypothetical protein
MARAEWHEVQEACRAEPKLEFDSIAMDAESMAARFPVQCVERQANQLIK